ncbi:MAG: septum formation initiator family protein [Patescibacteria group bacterium]
MRNFQQKKKSRNILQSLPVLILLTIILCFFAWGVIRFLVKMGETSKNKKIAEMKVFELSQTKEKLANDIESLKSDKGIEENIRAKFGLAKEGEGLIVVVDDKNAPNLEDKKQNWFIRFWNNWFK